MRLNDERRSSLKIDDIIIFTNNDTQEELAVKVIEVRPYKDLFELYLLYDTTEIGYTEDEAGDPCDMYQYYPKEKIEQYGALAIRIQVI